MPYAAHHRRERGTADMRRWRAANRERDRNNWRENRRRKREWLNGYKAERGCCKCPERHPACLDFHHRDPAQKLATIALVWWRWSVERLKRELEKCDVMCSNCHRKEHWAPENE